MTTPTLSLIGFIYPHFVNLVVCMLSGSFFFLYSHGNPRLIPRIVYFFPYNHPHFGLLFSLAFFFFGNRDIEDSSLTGWYLFSLLLRK